MDLFQCAPQDIDRAWADGASKLAEATKWASREITPDQLKMMLARGERTLIGARDAEGIKGWAAIQVQQLPNIRSLYIYAIYAPGITSPEVFEELRKYAKAHGCSVIRGACSEAVGRLWERKFQAKTVYAIYEIEVGS